MWYDTSNLNNFIPKGIFRCKLLSSLINFPLQTINRNQSGDQDEQVMRLSFLKPKDARKEELAFAAYVRAL